MARIDDRFLLIDTAGLKDPNDVISKPAFKTKSPTPSTLPTSSSSLLIARNTLTTKTKTSPNLPSSQKKPVLLLLNKSDLGDSLPESEFLRLGIKPTETFRISATTDQGNQRLKERNLQQIVAGRRCFGEACFGKRFRGRIRATARTSARRP